MLLLLLAISLAVLFRTHISLYYVLIPITILPPTIPLRRHLMVVSCREDEESAPEFPPLSQIPASLASRRRRRRSRCRRWNEKAARRQPT